MFCCRAAPAHETPGRSHRILQTHHRASRRRGAIERPRQSAERDHARADRRAGERDDVADREASGRRVAGQRPEHNQVGGQHQQQAPQHRLLAQSRRFPSEIEQPPSPRGETLDRPCRESEQPQFLRGRRIDCQPISIIGVALRLANLICIAIAPDSAFSQQPMRREPRTREQNRRPPRVSCEHHAPTAVLRPSRPARTR